MKILIYISIALATIFLPLIIMYCSHMIYQLKKGEVLPKKRYVKTRKSFFKRVYWEFPKMLIHDRFHLDPDEFTESGLHLFVGEQGSGKTISLVHYINQLKAKFPKSQVRTNMFYRYENGRISSWEDLVFINNGTLGQIDVLDEIHQWFNSLESKNFPPEMLSEISQQRKQRKVILGTAQIWQRVAKPIREQVKYVYKPITIAGSLTIVRKYKPIVVDDGSIDDLKLRSIYFFVHDDNIRNSFDTYQKIEAQSLKGYKPISEQIGLIGAGISQKAGDTAQETVPNFFKHRRT